MTNYPRVYSLGEELVMGVLHGLPNVQSLPSGFVQLNLVATKTEPILDLGWISLNQEVPTPFQDIRGVVSEATEHVQCADRSIYSRQLSSGKTWYTTSQGSSQ
jgi:hypothetical protein